MFINELIPSSNNFFISCSGCSSFSEKIFPPTRISGLSILPFNCASTKISFSSKKYIVPSISFFIKLYDPFNVDLALLFWIKISSLTINPFLICKTPLSAVGILD